MYQQSVLSIIKQNLAIGDSRVKDLKQIPLFSTSLDVQQSGSKRPLWAKEYLHIDLHDDPCQSEYKVIQIIQKAIQYMHQNIQNGIVVNCAAGLSRSPTVVIAYLMKYEDMSFCEAFKTVDCKRPGIGPNELFKRILMEM